VQQVEQWGILEKEAAAMDFDAVVKSLQPGPPWLVVSQWEREVDASRRAKRCATNVARGNEWATSPMAFGWPVTACTSRQTPPNRPCWP
jgi:hypothetical protein